MFFETAKNQGAHDGTGPTTFEHVLRQYRRGESSIEGLVSQIDSLIADGELTPQTLWSILDRQIPGRALESEVFEAIRQRLRSATADQDSERRYPDATGVDDTADLAGDRGLPVGGGDLAQGGAVHGSIGEGDTLNGRYELIKCVGTGGVSTVYKALDRHKLLADDSNPYVAVKILNRKFHNRQHWLDALEQEAERCRRLVHPYIVKVYGFMRDGPTVYITMEYLSGKPLTQQIRREDFHGMPATQALYIINAMGAALSFAHECGIVHCDFKPANVFLTCASEVKLIDFGIARIFGQGEGAAPSAGFRPYNAVTPAYASPDILARREPNPCDDVYALACTAYELLTGAHPFYYKPATEAREAGLKVMRRHGLSHRQWKAIQRALAFDRLDRTPTIARFLRELNGGRLEALRFSNIAATAIAMLASVALFYLHSSTPETPISHAAVTEMPSPARHQSDPGADGKAPSSSAPGESTPSALAPASARPVSREAAPPAHAVGSSVYTGDKGGRNEDLALATSPRPPDDPAIPARAEAVGTETEPVVTGRMAEEQQSAVQTAAEQAEPAVRQGQRLAETGDERQPTWEIANLLAQAKRQMAAQPYTSSKGQSALKAYRKVLERDPDYERALEGTARIKSQYRAWAGAALRSGDWDRAASNLNEALALRKLSEAKGAGEETALRPLQEELARREAKEDLTKGQEEQPGLEVATAATQRAQELERLYVKAQQRLAAQRLTRPMGDNAWETFRHLMQLDPNDPRGHEGLRAIAQRLEAMARAQQRKGNLRESLAIAEEGLRVLPSHIGLRVLRDEVNR
ncbi:MAG: protein kinase domain-containing protein [Gammaproteobacteria bacterium]